MPENNLNGLNIEVKQIKENKFSRIKFYTLLLVINLFVILHFNLIYYETVDRCRLEDKGECLVIGVIFVFIGLAMPYLLIIINFITILIYEYKKRKDRKNRFLIIIFVLIMYAGLSGKIFKNLFFEKTLFIYKKEINCNNLSKDDCRKYNKQCVPIVSETNVSADGQISYEEGYFGCNELINR